MDAIGLSGSRAWNRCATTPIRWVEVTGHFDDLRAIDCHRMPDPLEYSWYLGADGPAGM